MQYSVALAETLFKRYPDPDQYPYKPWSYPQGFMLWGFIRLWEATGNERYRAYALRYAENHVDDAGNNRDFAGNSLDDIMAGSVLVWAFRETGLERYRVACDRIRRVFDTYPRLHDGGFWHADWCPEEMWVDGLFMGLMFITKYGRYIGDTEWCFGETVRQLGLGFSHCRRAPGGLLVHAWSQNRKAAWADKESGRAPEVWCEGLGWYAMILVEVLELLPKNHPGYPQVLEQLRLLLASLKDAQDPETGLWYQIVDRGDRPDNWHDTSGSAMFTYTVQKAVELGLADKAVYGPVARMGYTGIVTKAITDADGLIDIIDACNGLGVQENYDAYIRFPRVVNAQETVAAFLWATTIMEKGGLSTIRR